MAAVDHNPFRNPSMYSPQANSSSTSLNAQTTGSPFRDPSTSSTTTTQSTLAPPGGPAPGAPSSSTPTFAPPAGPPPSSSSSSTSPRIEPQVTGALNSKPSTITTPARETSPAIANNTAAESSALNEELPPAYTPAPDARQGEQSVEFGPQRPFQQAPPPNPPLPPRPTGGGYFATYPTSASHQSGSYYGGSYHYGQQTGNSYYNAYGARPYMTPQTTGSSWSHYPGQQAQRPPLPPRPPQHPQQSASLGALTTMGFAPPSQSSPSASSPVEPAGDGKPTISPTPGHPLLRDGNVLVYPAGYECPKCFNTGYKDYDPGHPCRKCWDKYSKPYTGALTYADWTNTQSTMVVTGEDGQQTRRGTNWQRPLKRFPSSSGSGWSAYPTSGYRPSPGANAAVAAPHVPPRPGPGSWSSPQIGLVRRPPPGATVVQPGDPRIGGRLCWKCHGAGQTPVFIFDMETCRVCNGLGRLL